MDFKEVVCYKMLFTQVLALPVRNLSALAYAGAGKK
jgi:hypothetical protein